MKILHLLHQYLPEKVGGTELYTRTLARAQVEAGNEVSIFAPTVTVSDWEEPASEAGIQVYRLPLGSRSGTAVFQDTFRQKTIHRGVQRVLERSRPDIVHIEHMMGLPVSLVDLVTAEGIPFVITLHDYWYKCANAQLITNYDEMVCSGPNWYLNCARCALARVGQPDLYLLRPVVAPVMAYRNLVLRKAFDKASCLIAPTAFVRQTYTGLGVDLGKIVVVPHGIQPPAGERPSDGRDPGIFQIVYVGGLSPQKGIHTLIEAVNELPADRFNLAIYGDLEAFPDYIARLRGKINQPFIYLKGRLPHERLWDTLAGADVVVVPSLWYETASLIVQEAFAAGVPVVASDIGALRERVRDGVDGRLFPPGDAAKLGQILVELAENPEYLARLAAQIAPVFTIEAHLTAVQKIYQLALADSSAV